MSISNPYNPLQVRYGGSTQALVFGHGLKEELQSDGKKLISVDMVEDLEGDNTLPMSAAGVNLMVGNIQALLATV